MAVPFSSELAFVSNVSLIIAICAQNQNLLKTAETMAAPALPNLYNYTYQRPGQDILRIFCFKNCHAHQTEISSNPHKINQTFNFTVQQYQICVIHQPLKFLKVWHVGTQNVGNFMLSSNI